MTSIAKIKKNLLKVSSNIRDIEKLLGGEYDPEIAEMEDYYKNFRNFIPDAWEFSGASGVFLHGWHIDAIADHLQAVLTGDIKKLLISIPPRMGKSTICSVMFPAYSFTIDPKIRFMTSSYNLEYAMRDNRYMQRLIKSQWYQSIWGRRFFLRRENRIITETSLGGMRNATSVSGSNTGEGGNIVLCDDPNNMAQILSPTRELTNVWWDTVMPSRKNSPLGLAASIVIQQRGHDNDLTGHILAKDDPEVVYLCLPMEFVEGRRCSTIVLPGSKKMFKDPREMEGEILCPLQHNETTLKNLKIEMGSYAYSAQYQQKPSPEKGAVFEKGWFKLWKNEAYPSFDFIVQSWDTAISTEVSSSFSASTTYGVFKDRNDSPCVMLLNSWFGRLEWTDLRKMIMQQSWNIYDTKLGEISKNSFKPDYILIEAKANGLPLIQSLRDAGIDCIGYNPPKTQQKKGHMDFRTGAGKIQRARIVAPMVENGRIWLPAIKNTDQPEYYADHFREVCSSFPTNTPSTKDIVDTFTMTLDWLRRKGYVYPTDETPPPEEIIIQKEKGLFD